MSGWAAVGQIGGALLGGGLNWIKEKDMADREYERQVQFAQHGIRWRVQDAIAAGLHPLAAIGASTTGYKPQYSSGNTFDGASMGQGLARIASDNNKMSKLKLEEQRLNNQILQYKFQQMKKEKGLPPADSQPFDYSDFGGAFTGQKSPAVLEQAVRVAARSKQNPMVRAGVDTTHRVATWDESTKDHTIGEIVLLPDKELQELVTEDVWYKLKHYKKIIGDRFRRMGVWDRDQIKAMFRLLPKPKKGYEYRLNPNNGKILIYKLKSGEKSGVIDPRIIKVPRKRRGSQFGKKKYKSPMGSSGMPGM